MRRLLRFAAAACLAACACASASAATPVAVWDGDFLTTTKGDWTFDPATCAVAADGSYVTIGDTNVTFGATAAFPTLETTVILKYAGYANKAGKYQTLITFSGVNGEKTTPDQTSGLIGLAATKNDGLTGMWQGVIFKAAGDVDTYKLGESGRVAIRRDNTIGVQGYVDGYLDNDQSDLRASSFKVQQVHVGGAQYVKTGAGLTTPVTATGLKVLGIAIFNASLTQEEIAAYEFPSERYTGRVVSINIANALNDGGGWVDTSSATPVTTMAGDIPGTGWQNVGDQTGTGNKRQGSKTGITAWTGSATETLSDLTFAWNCGDADMGNLYASVATTIPFLKCYYGRASQAKLILQKMTFTDIPYAMYDAIVYFSGMAATANQSVKFNDVAYYGDTSSSAEYKTVPGDSTSWGAFTAPTALTYGGNVLRVDGFDSTTMEVKVPDYSTAWGIAAIQLVERASKTYTATLDASKSFSELTWRPIKPSAGFPETADLVIDTTAAATLTMDENVNVHAVKFSGSKALTLIPAADKTCQAAWDLSDATGGVTINASGLDGSKLAKNAVTGAPYSHWLLKGSVNGTPTVVCPTVPTGYSIASEVLPGCGVRLVVTAPDTAKFGAVSVNLRKDIRLEETDTESGLYPVARKLWGDFIITSDTSLTTNGLTFAFGSSTSYYLLNNTPPDLIQKQYMDDNDKGVTRTITVSGMSAKGYDRYRVLVYFSTDSADTSFAPMGVTEGTETTYYAGPNELNKAGGPTVKGSRNTWGHSGPNHNANAVGEGVNALATDVMTADSLTLSFLKKNGKRATPCALQVVKLPSLGTDYSLTMTGDADASTAAWNPPKTQAFADNDSLTITNTATRATFTADEDITVGRLKIVSAAGKLWVFKKNAGISTDFGVLDFSEAVEGVGYDCTEGFTACDLLLDYARTHNEKFTFFGSGENGALVDYGTAENNYTFSGHYVFDGGTHTFQNCSEGQGYQYFGSNATVDNPTLWVKDNTTLYFKSHNPCGWNTYADANGIVRIGNGATVVATNSASGTWYWSQQLYFEPGSTLEVATEANGFRLNGGCSEDKAQLYMPASAGGEAEITASGTANNLCIGDNNYSAAAAYVGDGSTLTISAAMKTILDGKAFGKYGAGTLALTGDLSAFGAAISVYGGTLEVAPTAWLKSSATVAVNAGRLAIVTEDGDAPTINVVTNGGEIAVSGAGLVYCKNYRGPVTVTGTAKVGYFVNINDLGRFKIPSGMTAADIRLFDESSGSEITEREESGGYITFEWKLTGEACWWDYEFNGNVKSTGTDATEMTKEGTEPFYNAESNALWIGHSTHWRDVNPTYPADFTAVLFGKMVSNQNHLEMGFGSSTKGTKNSVALACGDPAKDEVLLLVSYGRDVLKTVTMTVPNAYAADHLYAFSCETVNDGGTAKTQVTVYLDGKRLQSYLFDATTTLGVGFQIGSVHGGVPKGYAKATTANENAFVDFLRLYKTVLTDEALAEYAKEYPYVSVNGKDTRTFAGSTTWTLADAWTHTPYEGEAYPTNRPGAKSMVAVSASEDSTVTFDLGEAANYESLDVLAGSPITLRKGGTVTPSVAGFTTVGEDLTVDYDAIKLNGPVSVLAGKTLAFDFRSFNAASQWTSTTNVLTGMVTLGEGAQIVAVNLASAPGKTVEFVKNASTGQYELRVTLKGTLTADLAGDTNFGDLVWKIGEETVTPDWTKTVVGIIHVKTTNPTLTFASALSSDNSKLTFDGTNLVTLAAGGSVSGVAYDFTGMGENKVTFKYDPGPTNVTALYVRYDVDMDIRMYDAVLRTEGGRYEFKKIRIDGHNYDYHDRTVVVQEGDYLHLHDGYRLMCGLSLDVRGGEVHLGRMDGSSDEVVSYGRNGTRFSQSGGTVTVHASGKGQTKGVNNGFVIAHTCVGGGFKEFSITGGTFSVPESSICFNQPTNAISVSGTGVLRAKGAYFSYDGDASSAGIVNVTDGGTFEIGSLGVTETAMKSFILDGGTLRGYEADATFKSVIGVTGSGGTLASAGGMALTVSGGVTGSVGVVVSEGTVKLGKESGLGTVPVSVRDGATLDLAGFTPGNAITIVGAGVGGAGALVNTGSAVAFAGRLALSDDATMGGTGSITNQQGSIDFGGHVLTVQGKSGFIYAVDGCTATGGGDISVEAGSFATCGKSTSLGDTSLKIHGGGRLDLSAGTSISCRDFVTESVVVGTNATLVVNGTLDASTSTKIAKLELTYGAKLKGTGLTVSGLLTLGDYLEVEADEDRAKEQLAIVPEDGTTYSTSAQLNGTPGYVIHRMRNRLVVVKDGSVLAHVAVDTVPGTNFESLEVTGEVSDWQGSREAHGKTNVYVIATSEATGASYTQKVDYVAGPSGSTGSFEADFDGIEAGDTYTVTAYVEIDGGETEAKVRSDVVAARSVDGWIDEDAETFAGKKPGTGKWFASRGSACSTNDVIKFQIASWSTSADFQPTNDTLEIRSSMVKDIHYKVMFDCPGYYLGEEPQSVLSDQFAAITLVADADDECSFAVADGSGWQVVPRTVFAPQIGHEYEIVIRVDYMATNILYSVISAGSMTRLAECPLVQPQADIELTFSGSGDVAEIVGTCQDAHLMQVGDEEFWTFDDAWRAAGDTNSIVPLWRSRYEVTGDRGKFRILDERGLLELIWKKWHHWGIEDDGAYRFVSGNNWIEYADASGVVEENGGWLVTNEVGLAWIAEQATNQWFCGTVSVGTNLDLTTKNWTPIAQFSGVFDGLGHEIAGLNNTNVIDDVLLGEAGHYYGGPTNDWGRAAYGLFASATNAEFRDIAFTGVAISNVSASVASLLGASVGGSLVVSNVEVAGSVQGAGGVVAGLVGTAEGWDGITVVGNTVVADVEAVLAAEDDPRWAAGIMTVGGTNETVGALVVTGNVVRGMVANTVYNNGDGGNVAQVLAGTTWGTKFGEVIVTNNLAEAEVVAEIANHDGWRLGYEEWVSEAFPIVNLAAAVTRLTQEDGYRRFVEATSPASVPVDPVYRTARMLAGTFQDGVRNFAGEWMDTISAMEEGGNLWITGELLTNDTWQTVVVDRSIGFDLRGNTIYTVYDENTFRITHDSQLSITNGTIIVPEGVAAFGCVGASSVISNDINVVSVPGDFYDRTVWVDGGFAFMGEFLSVMSSLPSGTTVELDDGSGISVDTAANALTLNGQRIARFSEYRSLVPAGASAYVVELNDNAAPEFDLEATHTASADGTVTISLSGTRGGLYYAVQRKVSLVEKDWSDASEWKYAATDGALVSFTLPAEKSSGFYRVKVTDFPPEEE